MSKEIFYDNCEKVLGEERVKCFRRFDYLHLIEMCIIHISVVFDGDHELKDYFRIAYLDYYNNGEHRFLTEKGFPTY